MKDKCTREIIAKFLYEENFVLYKSVHQLLYNQGPGQALRVLAVMEPDIARSWEVTGINLEFSNELQDEASYSENSLHVFWKDPLVLGKNIILEN